MPNLKHQKITALIKQAIYQKNPTAEVILFGSHARGDAHKDSDWDVLILLPNAKVDRKMERAYREQLFEIELLIGEPISTFVYSKLDWETKHKVTPLYQSIKKKGIVLL